MPGTVQSSLNALTHLILTTATEHRNAVIYKHRNWDSEVEQNFQLRMSGFEIHILSDCTYFLTVNIYH